MPESAPQRDIVGRTGGGRRVSRQALQRDSGVEWIGAIPRHWEVAPLWTRYQVQLGKMVDEKRATNTELAPYLSNVDVRWDRVDVEGLSEMDFSPGERKRLELQPGDLLVCEGGEVGRTAMWRGELSGCYFQKAVHRVRRTRPSEVARFLFYVMRAAAGQGVFVAEGNPNTIDHLTAEKLRRHRFPFPPPNEQANIAAFLDLEVDRVDSLVRKRRFLLELLNERRQATVFYGVAGLLQSAARFDDPGLAWTHAVRNTWPAVKIKHVARLGTGHTPSRSRPELWEDCTIPWITTGEIQQVRDDRVEVITKTREKISELGLANSAAVLHETGTVVLCRTASAGFSAVMGSEMATSQDFATWTCSDRLLPRYLLMCLRAMRPDLQGRLAFGSTHKTIYMPDIEGLKIPLPTVEEQHEVLADIDSRLARIDALTDRLSRQLELLGEHRQVVITAAVTGQITVSREAA